MKLFCATCGLLLGDAEREIRITCPFCVQLRGALKNALDLDTKPEESHTGWQQDVKSGFSQMIAVEHVLSNVMFFNDMSLENTSREHPALFVYSVCYRKEDWIYGFTRNFEKEN